MGKILPKPFAPKDTIFPRKHTTSDIKELFHLLDQSRKKNVITEKEYTSKYMEILGQL
jgi:hypothetical protein